MQITYLIPLAVASAVQAMTLTEALAANNNTLSMLNGLLATQPALTQMLASASDITLLAPSNNALMKFVANPDNKAAAADPATLMSLLSYHVVKMNLPASAFTNTMQFVPTLLGSNGMNSSTMSSGMSEMTSMPGMAMNKKRQMSMMNMTLSSVTGGQVIGGIKSGNKVEIMTGLKEISTVETADIMFTGGVMHIIDTVLTMPKAPSVSAVDSQLTALAGALKSTNLLMAVDMMKDVTIFAPSNAAFQAIGSAATTLTEQQLAGILEYHVINGTVGYSTILGMGLANKSLPTLMGTELKVKVENNKIFINSAQVEIADILTSNGVMHVVNAVLNPANSTATAMPSATTPAIAFAGVSSASNVPFTSGITVTTTAPSASTKTAGAGHVMDKPAIGAIGAAALFGFVAGCL